MVELHTNPGPGGRIGASLAGFVHEQFDPPVWEKAAICLVDALGLAQIARGENTTRAISDLASRVAAEESGARLWTRAIRASLPEAVAANAVAVHAHFHDDSDPSSWCHPGSLIVPVSVAVAEAHGKGLRSVLRSIIAGYSTLNWLGDKEHVAHALINRGIRTSPALGTIGAAAAAAVGLGLDAQAAANAVAIAASITGGTLAPLGSGSDEWRVQNAQAARGGLLAAQLAANKVIGAISALDGPKGLLKSLAGIETTPESWNEPLRPAAILDTYAKPWATLGDNMAAVRAAKLMHDDGVDIDQIESVEVHIWRAYAEYPGTSFKGPFSAPVQALASTAFATAAMLIRGDLEFDVSFSLREDARILKLTQLVTVVPSDEGSKLDARLVVRLKDGTSRLRLARQAPRTWLYHDTERSASVFEARLQSSGYAPAAGRTFAADLFALAGGSADLPIADFLDRLSPLG